jgi:hypothetical protein
LPVSPFTEAAENCEFGAWLRGDPRAKYRYCGEFQIGKIRIFA